MRGSMQRLVCIAGLTLAASGGLAQPARSGLMVPPASTPTGPRDAASVPDASRTTTSTPAATPAPSAAGTPITLESRRVEPARPALESRTLGKPAASNGAPESAEPTGASRGDRKSVV